MAKARRSARGGAAVRRANLARGRATYVATADDLAKARATALGLPGFGCAPDVPWRGIVDGGRDIRATAITWRSEGEPCDDPRTVREIAAEIAEG